MSTSPSPARRRVLFVEDETDLQSAYRRYFAARYDMTFAGTGAEVFPRLDDFRPDVVVLDMHLPDADGIDILRRLRREFPDMPVVITTAYMSVEPMVEVMGMGHQGYLLKPFDLEELGVMIDDAR